MGYSNYMEIGKIKIDQNSNGIRNISSFTDAADIGHFVQNNSLDYEIIKDYALKNNERRCFMLVKVFNCKELFLL